MMVTWFRGGTKERKRRRVRQRVAKAGIVFVDQEGRKWNACVFRRSSVGAWRSKEAWEWSRKVSVVFERKGEERVAITDWEDDWNSEESLRRLFSRAHERRSGQDRRGLEGSVQSDRRAGADRRWTEDGSRD
jgi:hypothetical protein